MAHTFTIQTKDEMPEILKRVETEITKDGGIFRGDTGQGSFAGRSVLGMIKGKYHCPSGTEVCITITDKPFLVPYSTIEEQIREYFA